MLVGGKHKTGAPLTATLAICRCRRRGGIYYLQLVLRPCGRESMGCALYLLTTCNAAAALHKPSHAAAASSLEARLWQGRGLCSVPGRSVVSQMAVCLLARGDSCSLSVRSGQSRPR